MGLARLNVYNASLIKCTSLKLRRTAMYRLAGFLLAISFVIFAPASIAHHGLSAHYDLSKPVLVEGIVRKFDIKNPHSYLYVDMKNDTGGVDTWKCELPSLVILRRQNFTSDRLKTGDTIKLEGTAARRSPHGCVMNVAHLADGSILRMRFRPGNKDKLDTKASVAAMDSAISSGPDGIHGDWVRKAFVGGSSDASFTEIFTSAGKLAHSLYSNITDDPALRCSAASPVRTWGAPGTPTEIRKEGERIIIHHEFMDVNRVVHLNAEHPENQPSTEMGNSIGWYEGSTLVIETTGFETGVISPHAGGIGMLHSEALKLTERLVINPENGDLVMNWTADDPKYFTAQLSGGHDFVRTDYKVGPYNCVPEPED
jgi:hypothetical protein